MDWWVAPRQSDRAARRRPRSASQRRIASVRRRPRSWRPVFAKWGLGRIGLGTRPTPKPHPKPPPATPPAMKRRTRRARFPRRPLRSAARRGGQEGCARRPLEEAQGLADDASRLVKGMKILTSPSLLVHRDHFLTTQNLPPSRVSHL